MFLYTFVDQKGSFRIGKFPLKTTIAEAKEFLPLILSGEGGKLYGEEHMTVMDNTRASSGVEYSCVMLTIRDEDGGRISIPYVNESSADEGEKVQQFKSALMGKPLFEGGKPIISVTGMIIGTFTA